MRDRFPNIPHNRFGGAILLGLSAAGLALACSCVSYEPVQACQIFHSTPVIFRGRVIDHNDDRTGGFVQLTLYRFEVLEIFKGLPPGTKEVFIDPASLTSCYRVYETNRDYLIYTGGSRPAQVAAPFLSSQRLIQTKQIPAAWRNLGGLPVFMVGGCNPSRIVGENDADLAYLRSTLTRGPQTNGWIDGRAVQNFARSGRTRAFPGLSGATFTFKSTSGIQANASTQNDGAFRLDEIPSGTYSVSAESPLLGAGKLTSSEIVVPPGGCAIVSASFATKATIAGKVLGIDGKPAAGVYVDVGELQSDTQIRAVPDADATTNADGDYQISKVPLGKVVVAVNLNRAPTTKMPFDAAFAPGTQDVTAARVFDIRAGQQVTGVTLQLPPSLPFGDLHIDVKWPNGLPALGGARAFAQWKGSDAAFEAAPGLTNRVTLRLALGRNYEITADWLDTKPAKYVHVDRTAPQTVEFLQSGQVIELRLNHPRPY